MKLSCFNAQVNLCVCVCVCLDLHGEFVIRIPGDFKFDPLGLGKKDFAKNREYLPTKYRKSLKN
jgi:hypothetical protein